MAFQDKTVWRWITVIATKELITDETQMDLHCEIRVWANNKSDAMKKARHQLTHFYLKVEE